MKNGCVGLLFVLTFFIFTNVLADFTEEEFRKTVVGKESIETIKLSHKEFLEITPFWMKNRHIVIVETEEGTFMVLQFRDVETTNGAITTSRHVQILSRSGSQWTRYIREEESCSFFCRFFAIRENREYAWRNLNGDGDPIIELLNRNVAVYTYANGDRGMVAQLIPPPENGNMGEGGMIVQEREGISYQSQVQNTSSPIVDTQYSNPNVSMLPLGEEVDDIRMRKNLGDIPYSTE